MDKRNKKPPIPEHLERHLNEDQLHALENIRSFGGELKFVRRPFKKQTTPVVVSPDGRKVGVIEENGAINWETDLNIRN